MARRILKRPPTAEHVPDAGGLDRFVLTCGDSQAEVLPGRGALVSRFTVGEDDVLFCDRARLRERGTPPPGGV